MLVSILRANERNLARGAAIFLLAGVSAGCSSQVARFNSVDDVFTASTANQRQIIGNENQPFPGDAQPAAPLDTAPTQSVSREVLQPVTTQPLPEPAVAAAPKKMTTEGLAPTVQPLDQTATGSVAQQPERTMPTEVAAAPKQASGWSKVGGTMITVKEGQTVNGLANRYGVPARVLVEMNGLSGQGLQAGQKIIIPTYVNSNGASASSAGSKPVQADAKVASAQDTPSDNVPIPQKSPNDKVAVLPQTKKIKEGEKSEALDSSAASEPKEKGKGGTYTVVAGDTLSGIARKTGVGVTALKTANGMQDGLLRIGQKIKIPSGGSIQVVEAPALDPKPTGSTPPAKKAAETVAEYTPPKKADRVIEQAEKSGEVAPDATGIGKMRWPVRGRVISSFGKGGGKANDGIDIAVPEGTAIKAAENGVVIYAGDGLKDFGNTVLVRHENGLVTVYGNASELKVQRGQKVKRGEDIALSGMTGNATTPKLRFEVRKNSAPVDPSTFLE